VTKYCIGLSAAIGVQIIGNRSHTKNFGEANWAQPCCSSVQIHKTFAMLEKKELILVLGSQPAGDVSYKPGGVAFITFRQTRSYPRNP